MLPKINRIDLQTGTIDVVSEDIQDIKAIFFDTFRQPIIYHNTEPDIDEDLHGVTYEMVQGANIFDIVNFLHHSGIEIGIEDDNLEVIETKHNQLIFVHRSTIKTCEGEDTIFTVYYPYQNVLFIDSPDYVIGYEPDTLQFLVGSGFTLKNHMDFSLNKRAIIMFYKDEMPEEKMIEVYKKTKLEITLCDKIVPVFANLDYVRKHGSAAIYKIKKLMEYTGYKNMNCIIWTYDGGSMSMLLDFDKMNDKLYDRLIIRDDINNLAIFKPIRFSKLRSSLKENKLHVPDEVIGEFVIGDV